MKTSDAGAIAGSVKLLSTRIAASICTAIVVGMLAVGLSPFGRPENGVAWIENENGLRFGPYATLISATSFPVTSTPDSAGEGCTIELLWQAGTTTGGPAILAFSTREKPIQLLLRDYRSSALLQKGDGPGLQFIENIGVPDVFTTERPVALALTSGARGTSVFVNGRLRGSFPQFHFGRDCHGRLVVGTSPVAYGKCLGKIFGLAILTRELRDSEVLDRYQAWVENRRPEVLLRNDVAALYLFREHTGGVVHNSVSGGVNLEIPNRFELLDQTRFEPFWREYRSGWRYWSDILVNVAGFVPLGFVFCACFLLVWPLKRPAFTTVVLGLAVSLTIEFLQSYLPTRSSGTTDLITNTLGTFLGTRFYAVSTARTLVTKVFIPAVRSGRLAPYETRLML